MIIVSLDPLPDACCLDAHRQEQTGMITKTIDIVAPAAFIIIQPNEPAAGQRGALAGRKPEATTGTRTPGKL